MDNVVAYIFSLVNLALTGVVTFYLNRALNKNSKKSEEKASNQNALANGVQALLRVKLIEYHDKFMERGMIPKYALDNYELMYEAYHDLHGNGMVTKLHAEVLNLPLEN